ncbi:hypothetical protein GW17_00011008 [Ensete ventricosum]|uniref:Uncharacterized protein n=1 Tax=Ensete ventricosum TaxID=4639 RepID=A0A444FPX8_ENSVE|nr:hypothetical protein GW17_00011008 [Ensete ventricosum]RZR74158.1 hypothetical protein BHM03_00032936 [Ensete ventricosum]
MVNRVRWGKPDPWPKQPQVGCKCKLARKLLEPLIRTARANKTSVKMGYSPRVEEAQSGALIEKRSHKERLTTVETYLDVLETSLEKLDQGQRRLLEVESSQEVKSRIDRVESLVDRLTKDPKDSVRHLHEVVAELTAKVLFELLLMQP